LFSAASGLVACGGSEMKADAGEQAVLIHLQTSRVDFDRVVKTEDELIAAVDEKGLGEVDGHELAVDGSEVVYFTTARTPTRCSPRSSLSFADFPRAKAHTQSSAMEKSMTRMREKFESTFRPPSALSISLLV